MAPAAQKVAQMLAIALQLALFPACLAPATFGSIACDRGFAALDLMAEPFDLEAVLALLEAMILRIGVRENGNGERRERGSHNDDFRAKHGNFLSVDGSAPWLGGIPSSTVKQMLEPLPIGEWVAAVPYTRVDALEASGEDWDSYRILYGDCVPKIATLRRYRMGKQPDDLGDAYDVRVVGELVWVISGRS
jgi:hypothetical protein